MILTNTGIGPPARHRKPRWNPPKRRGGRRLQDAPDSGRSRNPSRGEYCLGADGCHAMHVGLSAPIGLRQSVDATLYFEKAGPLDFTLEVEPVGKALEGAEADRGPKWPRTGRFRDLFRRKVLCAWITTGFGAVFAVLGGRIWISAAADSCLQQDGPSLEVERERDGPRRPDAARPTTF